MPLRQNPFEGKKRGGKLASLEDQTEHSTPNLFNDPQGRSSALRLALVFQQTKYAETPTKYAETPAKYAETPTKYAEPHVRRDAHS